MSAIFVPTLYVMSGLCAFAALHHGIAAARRRRNRIHLLFTALSLVIALLLLAKAGAYQAATAADLVALRKWEASAIALFFMLFPWFIAEYTGERPTRLLAGMTLFWVLMLAVNAALPYGVQHAGPPQLAHLELPWGERVVDLRVVHRSGWHLLGWLGILGVMIYSIVACRTLHRHGPRRKARALAWALGLFYGLVLFNLAANFELIRFVHLSDFGFIALIVMMDLEMMVASRDEGRRMREVLDHLPAAVCLKDVDGRVQLVNRSFETYFHVRQGEVLGKTDWDRLPAEQAARLRADEARALATGQEIENEHVIDWDGRPQVLRTFQFPLLRPDGSAYAVCGVYVDVTESRQKDEMLDKFRRQIWHSDRLASTGAITGSLAHELCQPLAAILNNAQAGLRFLEHGTADPDEMREILEDVVRDDKRAAAVINGLRAMLQQQEVPHADIDMAQCIDEVMVLLHSELIRSDVDVETRLEPQLTVRANKTQIQQVVLNLVINALEAMTGQPAGQRGLQVAATRSGDKVTVSVRDSGVGIAPDMLDRVFEGFYTTKPQGLGIGLDVCRSIIESHRGTIWAERNPDHGVTFRFSLPAAGAAAIAGQPASAG